MVFNFDLKGCVSRILGHHFDMQMFYVHLFHVDRENEAPRGVWHFDDLSDQQSLYVRCAELSSVHPWNLNRDISGNLSSTCDDGFLNPEMASSVRVVAAAFDTYTVRKPA